MSGWPFWLVWSLALVGLGLLVFCLRHLLSELAGARTSPAPVSLLLVVRNGQDVIEGAIREIVARHGWWPSGAPGCELVIVDDGSTDDTPAIVERLARSSRGFVRIVRGPAGDTPVRDPLDLGLRACQGRAVSIVDLGGNFAAPPLRGGQKDKRDRQRN